MPPEHEPEATQVEDVVVTGVRPDQPNWLERQAGRAASAVSAIANVGTNIVTRPASYAREEIGDRFVRGAAIGDADISSSNIEVLEETGKQVLRAERRNVNPEMSQNIAAFSRAADGVSDRAEGVSNNMIFRAAANKATEAFIGDIRDGADSVQRIADSTQDGAGEFARTVVEETGITSGNRMPGYGVLVGGAVAVGEAGDRLNNVLRGVEAVSDQNVPGVRYMEREIPVNGSLTNVRFYGVANPDGEAWVVVKHDGRNPLGSDEVKEGSELANVTRAFGDQVNANLDEYNYEVAQRNSEARGGISADQQRENLLQTASANAIAEARLPSVTPQIQMAAAPSAAPAI